MPAHFGSDLRFSYDQSNAPFWEEVYKSAFPDFAAMVDVRKDGWAQRAGIDRNIVTSTGRIWTVDEKVRREKWPDILLEYMSDESRSEPGWAAKDVACDYIAYAFLPTKECYLLPVAPLQRAWRICGQQWIQEYGVRRAQNAYRGRHWTTLNCPVPIPILMRKISEAMFFRWKSEPVMQAPDQLEAA